MFRNPFDTPGRWFKANLHTHSTISDGEVSPSERARQYREKGYQVLAMTDHNRTSDVSGLSTEDFLVIRGMETHPECPGTDPYHLVCLNVPQGFDCSHEPDPNGRIRMVKAAGGDVIMAHPYWCGHNINHMLALDDVIAVEVFNATCTKIGKGYSSVQWDDLLVARRFLPAVAVDDCHHGRDIFMGWTMIRAEELTVPAVMDALRTGCFYASCGPVIEDARIEKDSVKLRCSTAAEVHLIAQRSNGRSFYADDRGPITELETPLSPHWSYVRIEIVDARGARAWTNPFML